MPKYASNMANSDYSRLERFLHRLALSWQPMLELTFQAEKAMFKSDLSGARDSHVFIAGLARSGSTMILSALYRTGRFRSLIYRDMPFVLAPNLWRKITGTKKRAREPRERSHGDRIKVNVDSPEALEEVFWRMVTEGAYIHKHSLRPHSITEGQIQEFRTFVNLVLNQSSANRYLSKNNNNILRLNALHKAFPDAHIVIPFRHPLEQAYSLLNQHRRFLKVHKNDPFSKDYMDWLAHHEFGANHKPCMFSEERAEASTGSLDYWLRNWIHVYSHLADEAPANTIWISYEQLCSSTSEVWSRLNHELDLNHAHCPVEMSASIHSMEGGYDEGLYKEARLLYERLLDS